MTYALAHIPTTILLDEINRRQDAAKPLEVSMIIRAQEIVDAVAREHNLPPEILTSPRGHQAVSAARDHAAHALQETGFTHANIASVLCRRDQSTVSKAIARHRRRNPQLQPR